MEAQKSHCNFFFLLPFGGAGLFWEEGGATGWIAAAAGCTPRLDQWASTGVWQDRDFRTGMTSVSPPKRRYDSHFGTLEVGSRWSHTPGNRNSFEAAVMRKNLRESCK